MAPWGARGGPVAVPACPFPLQPKRPRCHQCSSVCVLPCLPRRPQPSSGGTAGGGRAEGALHPRAVLQGKPCFPSKGCNPGLTGLAGGQGPWLSLWGGGWVPPRLSELLFLGRAAVPPRTGPAPSCGSCEPAVTPSLCRAGLPQAWLWMGTVWGGSNPSLCSPRSCFTAGERLVQQHHLVQLVTRSVHLTP